MDWVVIKVEDFLIFVPVEVARILKSKPPRLPA